MYAVIFTYNFDISSEITLFNNEQKAKDYLRESYLEECRIEQEENGWDIEKTINEDCTYATIVHSDFLSDGEEYEDVCEYRLCHDVRDMRNE